jgi:hypothetical protein
MALVKSCADIWCACLLTSSCSCSRLIAASRLAASCLHIYHKHSIAEQTHGHC